MYKYIIKRLLLLVPTLIGVVVVVYTILAFIPGDPGRLILGVTAEQAAVDQFNAEFGLDKPFLQRLFNYIGNILFRFDFGKSYRSRVNVLDEMKSRLAKTFKLAVGGVILVVTLGVPLGILSAIKRSTIVDASITVYAMFLAAIPGFWLGMILIYIFGLKLGILPTYGVETWRGYILPLITLGVPGSSGFIRLTRVTMLETVNQEYIKTARAKGCPERVVIWKHALKNAVLPLINATGLTFSGLLGGAVILETIFSIQGIGLYAVTAIKMRDIPVVMVCTIFLATIFCLIVVLIDLLYAYVDPRIRAKFSS